MVITWVFCGFRPPIAQAELSDAIAALRRMADRPYLEPGEWLPPARTADSMTGVVTAMVQELPRLTVDEWSERLGWERGRLLRFCKATFGLSSHELLRRYLVVAYRRLRTDGLIVEDCARVLNFHDGPTLLRALRRASTATGSDQTPGEQAASPQSPNGHFRN